MVVEITYEAVNVFQYQIPFNGSGLALLLLFAFRLPVLKLSVSVTHTADCVTHQSTLATASISNGTVHNASKAIQFNRWTLGVRKR